MALIFPFNIFNRIASSARPSDPAKQRHIRLRPGLLARRQIILAQRPRQVSESPCVPLRERYNRRQSLPGNGGCVPVAFRRSQRLAERTKAHRQIRQERVRAGRRPRARNP
jgi:hypothetical protein